MQFNYIRVIILRFLIFIGTLLGNLIKLFRKEKIINLNKIYKISFNRIDRIGDAVISKPFIILFSKFLKEELKLNIEIEVLTSDYNDFIFEKNKYFFTKKNKFESLDYGLSISKVLFLVLKNFLLTLKYIGNGKNISDTHNLFIDLVGSPYILQQIDNTYKIGCNLFLNNYLLDYSLDKSYVGGNNQNLIAQYIELVSKALNIPNFKNYINNNLDYFYCDYNFSLKKEGILIFVGNKDFRNFSLNKWYEIINTISKKYKNYSISVIDDNSNHIYEKIKSKKYSGNINLIYNNMTLNEFKDFSKQFELLIGIDGGGFNFIRTTTNSIGIYTLGNPNVWSIFSGNNLYVEEKIGINYIGRKNIIYGKQFGFIQKKSFFVPSLDYNLGNDFFDDFPVDSFIIYMDSFIKR